MATFSEWLEEEKIKQEEQKNKGPSMSFSDWVNKEKAQGTLKSSVDFNAPARGPLFSGTSAASPAPVANTQTVKPQVNINAPVMNTQPVNKPVTQPVARPVIDPLDEDALRINMANNRTEPTAIMKAASFVGKNLYNNVVKPAGQAIDRQYEKLDDYNFGEKALYDAYRIAQENSQNAWDEETLRLQRLKNDYDKLLSYMTPEQKVQYSRLPENKKKDYLDGIMAQLQTSKGAARAEEIRNIQDKTNQNLQKIGLSFESGMGGFKTGLKGAYNLMRGADKTVAKNASEYAFDELRPETKGALGVAMDLSNTVGNMAPSIALGLVGGPLGVGALGTAAMGVSSAGKGYDSAIGEGYTPEQAAAYGVASGVSEALLQKIAGALPGVSNAQGLVTRFLGKYGDDVLSKVVSNPSLRKALVTLLGNAASEGSEEGAQEIIDTFIRNAVLGEDNNINWKDVGYSALLGGMTGGAFALPGGVSTIVNKDSSIDTAQPAPETVENTVDAVQNDVEMPEEVTEENTAAETAPIKVGKATTIYNPYKGMVPVENDGAQYSRVSFKDNSFNDAEKIIESAEIVSNSGEKSYKRILKDVYNKIFGEVRNIQIKSLSFDNKPYDVTLNKNIVAKVVSDPNMSAEKLAVLDNLDSIVENSKYVGSSKYEQKGVKKKNTIRFDYFETETEINGNPYIVAFDVEVFPNQNNYRTHKVINEINLTPLTSADTGPEPAANVKVSGSNNIIPSDVENINTSAEISENNKPITEAVKRTVKAVNPNAENSQQIYRQIMTNNGFGDLVNRMDTIARRLGSEVQYYADDTGSEGYNFNNKIYLNINNIRDTADAEWKLFKHELTHSLEGTDAYGELLSSRAGAELFNKFLIDKGYTVTDEKGNVSASLDALANEISELYRRNGVELDPQGLNHEMVARFIEESDLFTNEESIRRLAQESPDFIQRILRWIKDTIANIGADADTRNLRNAERMFERALDQAAKGEYKNINTSKQYSSQNDFTSNEMIDSNGRQLTPEQQEYFKDSKVRDKEGRLLTVYHGTKQGGFTVFNRNLNYYTNNKDMADSYSPNGNMYEGYLDIKKPFVIDANGDKWSGIAIDKETKDLIQVYGGSVFKERGKWRTSPADIASVISEAVEEGELDYDGVIVLNVDDTGMYYKTKSKNLGNDYITFNSNQFKNIDNAKPTNNPDIRYSFSDKDYNAAVKSGDMEAAERMVREAAIENGYTSPKLYHGTPAFGFTKIDFEKMDDGISFFMTDSIGMAASYSAYNKVRKISDNISEEELNKSVDDAYDEMYYRANLLTKEAWKIGSEWDLDFNVFPDTVRQVVEEVIDGKSPIWKATGELEILADEVLADMFDVAQEYDAELVDMDFADFQESEKAEKFYEACEGVIGAIEKYVDLMTDWRTANTGIYALYANTENYLEVDAQGKYWNSIAYLSEGKKYNKTREIAKLAKDKGYNGVIFKNIKDFGAYGGDGVPSTVYIAFDGSQVKSADPVVYDDNGNVIPLSKRFDANNPDIRYSFKDDGKLTKKAESYLHRNTNTLLNDFLEITETDKYADARTLKRDINTFAEASVRNGEVDRAEAEKLFDTLYWDALKVNTDVYDKYRPLAEKIKSVKLYGGGLGSLEGEYRRKYFNKVRLVTDPSATKIDSFYKELSELYPELFDPEIANIEEQVPAMAEAIDYIYNRETKLSDLVKNIDKRYNVAKEEFMKSLDKFEQGIEDVIRYNNAKEARAEAREALKAERNETAEKILTDKEFSKSFFKDFTAATRAYDKLTRKVMLTPDDTNIMRQLSEGTISWDEVERRSDEFNIDAIKKVYDAYNAKHKFESIEKELKAKVTGEYRSEAEDLIENSDAWEDKPMGAMYMRETMERNIEDVTRKGNNKNRRNEDAYWINKTYFKPVHENEAKSTRLKNELSAKVKALNLGTKPMYTVMIENEYTGTPVQTEVSESGLVQLYGEGLIDDNTLERLGADKEKIHKAVNEFRGIYNQLIEMANETLIRNGYRPVEYRKDYFPHFTENKPDSTLGKVAAYFGIEMRVDELPTDIAGITHTFRPGKKWVGNFLERKTKVTDYDALKGFDRYINGAADVIFHTDDIQRLRALESALRYKYSDEGTRKRIKEIEDSTTLTPEEKKSLIEDIMKANETSHLPNLVTEIRNYTDNLAGKKSISDRNWEHGMGRGLYNFTKKMENRVSANMVALNPGSWLTNFIPITQVSGIVDPKKLARAIWDTSKGAAKKDEFTDLSDFLVNRKGSEMTFKTTTDKIQDKLTKPFEMIDSFTAEIVTRALYYDKMAEVKNEAEALEYANEMAARVMADRSKGAKPTAFNAQNPVAKLFTMFQVEVNNQYSYMFKDLPAEERKKGLANLAWAFVKMFLGAYLYNEVYEKIIGRRAAFDPVDIMASAIGDFTNPDVKKSQAVANAAADVVDELPFVSGILGGGRVPISSALPSISKLNEAGVGLISGEMNSKKAAQQLGKELIKPAAYLVPQVGGGQVKKTLEGISTVAKGGEVTYDSEGNERLKYPIEDKTPLKYLQAGLFGKSSLKESQDYYNNGMPTLTVKQTQNYHKAVEAGINYKQYMAALQASKGAESDKDKDGKTIALSLAKNKKAAIDEAVKEFNLSKKQKELLYEANDVSEKVW